MSAFLNTPTEESLDIKQKTLIVMKQILDNKKSIDGYNITSVIAGGDIRVGFTEETLARDLLNTARSIAINDEFFKKIHKYFNHDEGINNASSA